MAPRAQNAPKFTFLFARAEKQQDFWNYGSDSWLEGNLWTHKGI